MRWFAPTWFLESVENLTPRFLREQGIKGLILDVDNTLTTHDNPQPKEEVGEWLDRMREAGIKMMILSNNTGERVEPFARVLGLPYIAKGKKPLKSGVRRALAAMGTAPGETLMVGDQVFTDILAGKNGGLPTLLVRPIRPEKALFFRFKRWLERGVLPSYGQRWPRETGKKGGAQ